MVTENGVQGWVDILLGNSVPENSVNATMVRAVNQLTFPKFHSAGTALKIISNQAARPGSREKARVFETLNFSEKAWFCGIECVFRQHNSLQCDQCAQQSIEVAPTGGKLLQTEALMHSP